MFIKELKIVNFKSFSGEQPSIEFCIPDGETQGSGLNIFVGENNTGKSTIFEAINFLRNSEKKLITTIDSTERTSVELLFKGNVAEVIDKFSQENKKEVFKRYIFDDDSIKLSRVMSEASIQLWSSEHDKYINESGIDAPIKRLFDTSFVWANANPGDETKFGSTTICGYLLKEIVKTFKETDDYRKFQDTFRETFNDDNSALRQDLQSIESDTQRILGEQFSSASIKFVFDNFEINSFFKNIQIDIDDGVNTRMEEKGSGMQRALALSMLQIYAEKISNSSSSQETAKPFFLFIDEPEVCLHPKAQKKLLNALLEISKIKQVFIATHSPFFLSTSCLDKVGLFIFKKQDNNPTIERISNCNNNRLLPWSPTWGEINFLAYDLPTIEFHNELYGFIEEKRLLDNYKIGKSTIDYIPDREGVAERSQQKIISEYIRHQIHHPENRHNDAYTNEQLQQSISDMRQFLMEHRSTDA